MLEERDQDATSRADGLAQLARRRAPAIAQGLADDSFHFDERTGAQNYIGTEELRFTGFAKEAERVFRLAPTDQLFAGRRIESARR
jgi:hypothetical protein